MRKQWKRVLITTLCAVLTATGFTGISGTDFTQLPVVSMAAEKASLYDTEINLSIGKSKESNYQIGIDNKVKGATYKFISSNPKVVTVDNKGILIGIKKGTAKITCNQVLKGKTTLVGVTKITVKEASFFLDSNEPYGMAVAYEELVSHGAMNVLAYRNSNAKYTAVSSSKDLTLRIQDEYGFFNIYGTAKKAGNYTVTIKETYKKKTRNIGTLKIVAHEMEFQSEVKEVGLGQIVSPVDDVIRYYNFKAANFFEVQDPSILVEYKDESGSWWWKANKLGETKVTVYADDSKTTVLGTYSMKVVEIPATDIYMSETYSTYVGEEYLTLSSLEFDVEPYETTDQIKVVSSDATVLKVDTVDGESGAYKWALTPLKKGKATVTVTCGKISSTCDVTVYASEDEYYEN